MRAARFATVVAAVVVLVIPVAARAGGTVAADAPEPRARAVERAAWAPREGCARSGGPAAGRCLEARPPAEPAERASTAVGVSLGPGVGGSLGVMLRPDLELLVAARFGVVKADDEEERLYKSAGVGLRLWGTSWLFVDGRLVLTNVTTGPAGTDRLGYEIGTGCEILHLRTFGLDVHAGITAVDGFVFRSAGFGITFYP